MTGLPASRKSNITEDAGLEKERLEYVVEKEEELLTSVGKGAVGEFDSHFVKPF